MTIRLTPKQDEPLAACAPDDDLAWAKPHVDEALTEVVRGDVISRDEHRTRNAARIAVWRLGTVGPLHRRDIYSFD